jgi:glycogen debranching enzyme
MPERADRLVEGLLRAAERFRFRMPELHSGDSATDTRTPAPYPAACRPQAWSAASAIGVLAARLGLRAEGTTLVATPPTGSARVRVTGLHVGETCYEVRVGEDGTAEVTPTSTDGATEAP